MISMNQGISLYPVSPQVIYIEPTNVCNLQCIMCPQSTSPRSKGFMDFALFRKVVGQIPGTVLLVQLFYGGESLLHPQITEMVRYIKRLKPYTAVRIATNGTLLTPHLSRGLIEAGLDTISFSFDAPDKETYERIRKGANFEDTLHNIKMFTEVKEQLKTVKPFIEVEIIEMEQTKDKVEQFAENLCGLPIGVLKAKQFLHWGNILKSEDSNKTERQVCHLPWTEMNILWDGSVVPCCVDYNCGYLIGNVAESDMLTIWSNERMLYLRKTIRAGDFDSITLCASCKDMPVLNTSPREL